MEMSTVQVSQKTRSSPTDEKATGYLARQTGYMCLLCTLPGRNICLDRRQMSHLCYEATLTWAFRSCHAQPSSDVACSSLVTPYSQAYPVSCRNMCTWAT